MPERESLYWLDLNRFDLKPDKSTWLEMAAELQELGFDVSILTGFGRKQRQANSTSFKLLFFRSFDIPLLFRITLQFNILLWLLKNADRRGIVMLTSNNLFIVPILRLFGWNNILLDYRTLPVEVHSFKDKLDRLLYWKLPNVLLEPLVTGHSFITEPLRASVAEEFGKDYPDSVIWTSGVNCVKFQTVSSPKKNSDFVLFYHGSISLNRGLPVLIDAIAMLNDVDKQRFKLIMVGDGAGMESITRQVRGLNLDKLVEFRGMLAYEEMPHEISKADCCVCPLPDRKEWNVSSPLKVFEYLASSKPVILTPILAHTSIHVEDDYVIWAKGDDARALCDAIHDAMQRIEQLTQAARHAPLLVKERFDWKVQASKLSDYIRVQYGL